MDKENKERARIYVITSILLIFVLCSLFVLGLYIYYGFASGVWQKKLDEHFLALVGMPFCVLFAVALIFFFRVTYGTIEFEAIGFRFKGASGPIILWCMAFMALVLAAKIAW